MNWLFAANVTVISAWKWGADLPRELLAADATYFWD